MPDSQLYAHQRQESAHLFAEVAKGGGEVLPQSGARAGGRACTRDGWRLIQRRDDHLQSA